LDALASLAPSTAFAGFADFDPEDFGAGVSDLALPEAALTDGLEALGLGAAVEASALGLPDGSFEFLSSLLFIAAP
jgi:hypothetical protein